MNMIHGTLIVDPAMGGAADESTDQAVAVTGSAARPEAGPMQARRTADEPVRDGQDAEEAERAAEIADLARRVLAGVVLTLPVLYAVMAHDVFRAWVRGILQVLVRQARRPGNHVEETTDVLVAGAMAGLADRWPTV